MGGTNILSNGTRMPDSAEAITSLPKAELLKCWRNDTLMRNLPEPLKKAFYYCAKMLVLETVREFNGVPNVEEIAHGLGMSPGAIHQLMGKGYRKEIKKAMEDRAIGWLEACPDRHLLSLWSQSGTVTRYRGPVKKAFYSLIDKIILREVQKYNGIPHFDAIGRALSCKGADEPQIGGWLINSRVEHNDKLRQKAEAHGLKWLRLRTGDEILKLLSDRNFISHLPDYAKEPFYKRVDKILITNIKAASKPTKTSLAGALGINRDTLRVRMSQNSDMWAAYYHKLGMSIDGAVEFALQRGDLSAALSGIMSKFIRNFEVYQRAVGIAKSMNYLMKGKICEITQYPSPLATALKDLGINLEVIHVQLQDFRKTGEAVLPESTNVFVLHGIDRLKSHPLTELMMRVHNSLAANGVLIATHSAAKKPVDSFLPAMESAGFSKKLQGMMSLGSQIGARQMCEIHGFDMVTAESLKRKMGSEFGIMVFNRLATPERTGLSIPSFGKIKMDLQPKGGRHQPAHREITVPPSVAQFMAPSLTITNGSLPCDSFVLDIIKGEPMVEPKAGLIAEPDAIVGYKMKTLPVSQKDTQTNRLEVIVLKPSKDEDYHSLAKEVTNRPDVRQRFGIDNNVTKVRLDALKAAIKIQPQKAR
jgi:hypothetical protein